jgi:hypothetical protein
MHQEPPVPYAKEPLGISLDAITSMVSLSPSGYPFGGHYEKYYLLCQLINVAYYNSHEGVFFTPSNENML